MSTPGRPWWEWVIFGLAVLGGAKTLWDWIVSPFRQRPKLLGTLERCELRGLGATKSPREGAADTIDAAFDSELRLYVYAYNARPQHTYLKKWIVRVQVKGKEKQELTPVTHSALTTRAGPYIDPASLMPEEIRFEWRVPKQGWLYFWYPNIRKSALESAKFTLLAIDMENRVHHLFSGVVPAAWGKNGSASFTPTVPAG